MLFATFVIPSISSRPGGRSNGTNFMAKRFALRILFRFIFITKKADIIKEVQAKKTKSSKKICPTQ
jgi:hypothetical protein